MYQILDDKIAHLQNEIDMAMSLKGLVAPDGWVPWKVKISECPGGTEHWMRDGVGNDDSDLWILVPEEYAKEGVYLILWSHGLEFREASGIQVLGFVASGPKIEDTPEGAVKEYLGNSDCYQFYENIPVMVVEVRGEDEGSVLFSDGSSLVRKAFRQLNPEVGDRLVLYLNREGSVQWVKKVS